MLSLFSCNDAIRQQPSKVIELIIPHPFILW